MTKRIMLVHPIVDRRRDWIGLLLDEDPCYEFVEVDGIHEAHEIALRQVPELVVVGQSSFVDGVGLLQTLRSSNDERVREVWVIVVSSDDDVRIEHKAHLARVSRWLRRNKETSDFKNAVKQTLSQPLGDARNSRRILLAEDTPVVRDLTAGLLRDEGYSVVAVGDGQAALECAQQEVFDLVLSDNRMPRMGGIELTRNLRKLSSYASVPILIVSSDDATMRKRAGMDAGATDWILKPFDPAMLIELIGKLLMR